MESGTIVIVAPRDAYSGILDSLCWTLSERYWCEVTWKYHANRKNRTWTAYDKEYECSAPDAAWSAKELYRSYYRQDYA